MGGKSGFTSLIKHQPTLKMDHRDILVALVHLTALGTGQSTTFSFQYSPLQILALVLVLFLAAVYAQTYLGLLLGIVKEAIWLSLGGISLGGPILRIILGHSSLLW